MELLCSYCFIEPSNKQGPHYTTALSAGTEGASPPPAASTSPGRMSVEGGRTSLIFSLSALPAGPAPAEPWSTLCRFDAADPSSWGVVAAAVSAPSF